MKLLMLSYVYSPMVGGIETFGQVLAHQFTRMGHDVAVATAAPADGSSDDGGAVRVVRSLEWKAVEPLYRWCDAVIYNNITLKVPGPLLLRRKPVMVIHHTWLRRLDNTLGWQDRLKRWAVSRALNVCVSQVLAEDLAAPSHVIRNPFQSDLFRQLPGSVRDRDVVFLGRLVSDKGAKVVIDALKLLLSEGGCPRLSIIGRGEEEARLRAQVSEAGLEHAVTFHGMRQGEELVALLNRHRVMVVPSVWREVYGLVVLEGLACGLKVIASRSGGLVEAVGDAGELFENGNHVELAECIKRTLRSEETPAWRRKVDDHLALHQPYVVAEQYLSLLEGME